jgi:uncharacterized protein HemX
MAYGEPVDPRQQEMQDRLRSLTTAVVLLAVLAVVALGVALWALLSQNEDQNSGQQAASKSSVQSLRDDVDQLSDDVRNAASKQDIQQLADKLDALDSKVTKTSDDLAETNDTVRTLRQDVDDLQQRVEAL